MEQPSLWNDKVRLLLWFLVHSIFFSGIFSSPMSTTLLQDVTYDELEDLGGTCISLDNCQLHRDRDLLSDPYNCNCDRSCNEFDTCCVDSEFRIRRTSTGSRDLKCTRVYGESGLYVYMVDSCKRDWSEELVADLCRADGEARNDPMLLIPVTSQLTGITYKNYFCSVCNNDHGTDETTSWNLKLSSNSSKLANITSIPSLNYNATLKSWEIVASGRDEDPVPVTLSISVPDHMFHMTKKCRFGLVSNCSRNWADFDVKWKCAAYMAMITIPKNNSHVSYRNPHCAICNFESLDDMVCFETAFVRVGSPALDNVLFVSLFVLDDKPKKCGKDMVYDSLGKRCRAIKCPRNHSVSGGKCVSNR